MLPRALLFSTTVLAFAVVVLGAYVRLSDAGLGCPDWPGCYGQATPWHARDPIEAALAADPAGPVSHAKAWKEMLHRYLAGGLGLAVLAIAGLAWRRSPPARRVLPVVLLALVIFQALLGMWTVTHQLKPLVVTAHLLGGMATLSLLGWLAAREGGHGPGACAPPRCPARMALAMVVFQIALGGWVSANHAALACADLPTCQGAWWPEADFATAFEPGHALGALPAEALTAIHLTHRLGALLALAGVTYLVVRLAAAPGLRTVALWLAAVVAGQFALGLGNVLLGLALPVAVAHSAGAAILLLSLVWVNVRLLESPVEETRAPPTGEPDRSGCFPADDSRTRSPS